MKKLNLNLREVGAISLNVNTTDFQEITKLSKNYVKCFINEVNCMSLWNHRESYNVQLHKRKDIDGIICLYFYIIEEKLTKKEVSLATAELEAFNERIEAFLEDNDKECECTWGDIPDEEMREIYGRTIIRRTRWGQKFQEI